MKILQTAFFSCLKNSKSNVNFTNIEYKTYESLNPRLDAIKIALAYGLSGILWILLSDSMLLIFVKEKSLLMKLQIYKGWLFVVITSFMIYYLTSSRIRIIKEMMIKLYKSYEKLEITHNELVSIEKELKQQNSELQKSQKAYLESEKRYQLAVDGANDGIWDWDIKSGKVYFSHKWKKMLGFEDVEIQNTFEDWENLLHPEDAEYARKTVQTYLDGKTGAYENVYRLKCKDGNYKWILSRGQAIRDFEGKPLRMAGSHTDITEHKHSEEKMYLLAYHDSLTGLFNRVMFERRMVEEIEKASKNRTKIALLYLDLDNFKNVNDTLGHDFGDKLLIDVSVELKMHIKEKDLFRLSGDEFAIILLNASDILNIDYIVNELLKSLRKPWIHDNHEYYITASIGAAVFPEHGLDVTTLLKNADTAMYCSKDKGKNRFSFYTNNMNEKALYYIEMEKNLRYALINKEFILYYQPQIDLTTGNMIGVEALLRWMHPIKGMIFPFDFISFAEKFGFIVEIGEWVIREACNQSKKWKDSGYKPLNISINISDKQFQQDNFIEMITGVIEETVMDVSYLEIEITENTAMSDLENTIYKLNILKSKGIRIALDDFGVGYSSLNYLKKLPIDILKMDKTFIHDIVADSDEEAIVNAVIYLAQKMNLTVTAEGIETHEQLQFLKEQRCNIGQGYLFSRPIPAEDIEEIFKSNRNFLCIDTDFNNQY